MFLKISGQLGMPFDEEDYIAPTKNNVVFASGEYSFMLSLSSIVEKYLEKNPYLDAKAFTKLLWGDYYFNH